MVEWPPFFYSLNCVCKISRFQLVTLVDVYNTEESWPKDIVVAVGKGGTMTKELLIDWCTKVYNKRYGAIFGRPNLLIMDQATCHNVEVVKATCNKTEVAQKSDVIYDSIEDWT